jgi:hypothetical protein
MWITETVAKMIAFAQKSKTDSENCSLKGKMLGIYRL